MIIKNILKDLYIKKTCSHILNIDINIDGQRTSSSSNCTKKVQYSSDSGWSRGIEVPPVYLANSTASRTQLSSIM